MKSRNKSLIRPQEVSGRRKAPPGDADRDDDRGFRAHGRRTRSTDRDRAQKTGISDIAHFAYSTFAKAARDRRDNLLNSAENMRGQLEAAQDALAEAIEELKKIRAARSARTSARGQAEAKAEQAEFDEIALRRHSS